MISEVPITKNGNYYYKNKGCNNLNIYWGSQLPIKEKCIQHELKGKPCTNIWNNNTKRKIIVK